MTQAKRLGVKRREKTWGAKHTGCKTTRNRQNGYIWSKHPQNVVKTPLHWKYVVKTSPLFILWLL